MVSLRRTPSGRPRRSRRAASAGLVVLSALLAVMLGAVPASAQPSPEDAAAQLEQAQRDAEALTEEWHAAKDALDARVAEADDLREAVEPARQAVEAARAEEETYRHQVDQLAVSTFESGSLDQFNALLAAGSPQEFLEQMSALEMLSSDYKTALGELTAVVDRTTVAQADADAAASRAQAAADEAARAEQEVAARKEAAEQRIDDALQLLRQVTPAQRAANIGPAVGPPPPVAGGSGVGVRALAVAEEFLGTPYKYGGNGPDSFDCSGLTLWAWAQAGVSLPHFAASQYGMLPHVPLNQLQPGDLVFFYSDLHHVGIYIGNGMMVHAPRTGDVVKVSPLAGRNLVGAARP